MIPYPCVNHRVYEFVNGKYITRWHPNWVSCGTCKKQRVA